MAKLTPLGKNAKYWTTRAKIAQMSSNNNLENYKAETKKIFDEANKRINEKIKDLYVKFADEEGVSLEQAKKMLNDKERKEFDMSLDEYLKEMYEQNNVYSEDVNKRLAGASTKYRISRLEATQYQLQAEADRLYKDLDAHYSDWNSNEFQERYYQQLFDIFQGTGVGLSFAHINQDELDAILKKPWTGNQNFSQRLWQHKEDLIDKLQNSLSQSLINGEGYTEASEKLSRQLNTKQSNAARLITTESSFFDSMGQKKAFEELGVERYQNVAVLDNETCPICRQLDGRTFKVSAMKIGKNAPPYHPNCRDTITPYYNDKKIKGYIEGKRAARNDPSGKTYLVPANMKYDKWAQEYKVKDKDGNFIVEPPDYEVLDETGITIYLGNFKKGLKAKHFKKLEPLKKNNKDLEYNQLFNKHVSKTDVVYDKDSPGHFSYALNEIAVNPNRADNENDYIYTLVPHEGAHAIDQYAYRDLMRGKEGYTIGGALSEKYKQGLLAQTINDDFNKLLEPIVEKNIKANNPELLKNPGTKALENIIKTLDQNSEDKLKRRDRYRIASYIDSLLSDDFLSDRKGLTWQQLEDRVNHFAPFGDQHIVGLVRNLMDDLPKNITIKDIQDEFDNNKLKYWMLSDSPKIDWEHDLIELRNELRSKYDLNDLTELSDMFQGYTENLGHELGKKLSLNINGAGHSTGYFHGPSDQASEFLAEYYQDKLTKPKAFKILQEVLPNACKLPNEILKSALNEEARHFSGFGNDGLDIYKVNEKVKGNPFEVAFGYNDKGDIEEAAIIGAKDGKVFEKDLNSKELKEFNLGPFKNVFDKQYTDNIHNALQDATEDFHKAWNKHIGKVKGVTVNNFQDTGFYHDTNNINFQTNDLMRYGLEVPIHEGTHAIDRMAGREQFGHDVYFSHAYGNGIIQKTLNEEWLDKVKKIFNDTYDRSDIINELDKLDDMQMFSSLMNTKISPDDAELITDELDKGETFKDLVNTNPEVNMIFNKNYKDFQDVAFNNISQADKKALLGFLKQDLIDKYGRGPDVNSLSDMYQAFCERWGGYPDTLNNFGHKAGYFAYEPTNQSAEFVAQYHASKAANKEAAKIIEEEFPKTVSHVHNATAQMGK